MLVAAVGMLLASPLCPFHHLHSHLLRLIGPAGFHCMLIGSV